MITEAAEHTMIFNSEMVRATLDGRKTHIRRPIKPQPKIIHALYSDKSLETERIFKNGDQRIHCPDGKIGERLWVRETWGIWKEGELCSLSTFEYVDYDQGSFKAKLEKGYELRYKADNATCNKWRPSIHMPRWASRITLEITNIRVERVQEITEEDAKAEGCRSADLASGRECFLNEELGSYKLHFKSLWDSIYSKKFPWDSNPWVWVIEFKRIKP